MRPKKEGRLYHHCHRCGNDWSSFVTPDRCRGCGTREWKEPEKPIIKVDGRLAVRELLPWGSPCWLVWTKAPGGGVIREANTHFIGACRDVQNVSKLQPPESRGHVYQSDAETETERP